MTLGRRGLVSGRAVARGRRVVCAVDEAAGLCGAAAGGVTTDSWYLDLPLCDSAVVLPLWTSLREGQMMPQGSSRVVLRKRPRQGHWAAALRKERSREGGVLMAEPMVKAAGRSVDKAIRRPRGRRR